MHFDINTFYFYYFNDILLMVFNLCAPIIHEHTFFINKLYIRCLLLISLV